MIPKFYYTPYTICGVLLFLMLGLLVGCGSSDSGFVPVATATASILFSDDWPEAGTTERLCSVPVAAQAMDSTFPDQVVGSGSPGSCTSAAFVAAVASGGG